MVFLENFNFYTFLIVLNLFINKKIHKIVYLYNYPTSNILLFFLNKILKVKTEKYNLEINNFKLVNNECVLSRIYRIDLFNIQNKIFKDINSNFFKNNLYLSNFYYYYLKDCISGHMINDTIKFPNSLLTGYKIHYYEKIFSIKFNYIFLYRRNHNKIYQKFLIDNFNYSPYFYNFLFKSFITNIKNEFKNNLKNILKNLKLNKKLIYKKNKKSKIYFDKLGEFNLKKDYKNSDFFFYLYSNLNANDLIYKSNNIKEINQLKKEGIDIIDTNLNYKNIYNVTKKYYTNIKFNNYLKKDYKLKKSFIEYSNSRNYWSNFFLKHNIKLYLTWFKYGKFHISISDAINEIGGVSAVWERSFENQQSPELLTTSDIIFKQSFWNLEETLQNSKSEYLVSTGFLRDYSKSIVDKNAISLRKREFNRNVEVIFAVFDQNSNDKFTNQLLNNNYKYIIEFVLSKKNLGVIFKPKKSKNLYERLEKDTIDILNKAIKLKKCFIFEDFGDHQSNIPAILAASVSNLCIHTSLKAGTAAVECALYNKPTIIIDQEGYPYSKLNELRKNNIIFNTWESCIDRLSFELKNNSIQNFGFWGEFLNQFDDYNDGKGSLRLGNYCKEIINGFDKGYKKKDVLRNAYIYFKKKYGNKVVRKIYDN